jgi:hypothetical protein
MGLLANLDPELSDYGVVGLAAIVALTVSFKHGGSQAIDASTTDEKHSSQPTSSCSLCTTSTCIRCPNIQVRAWLLQRACGIAITALEGP